ncbi:conidial development fluffy [Fusarium beomiforme]|uniref:Conidial development fluffy n=1 Tax=Fusarium beomiforme TaxID=44412 RepID=A0A9P5DWN7_9HYPO|nr:conidial development fluffy [Fusarium beomiforme]
MQKLPNLVPAPPRLESRVPPQHHQQQQQQIAHPRVSRASSSRKSTTNHACGPCHKTKTKCDGKQPCARCRFSSNVCTYDTKVLSGQMLNRLTNAVNEQKGRLNQLETILAAMRNGTDSEAAEVMSWVRIGESVESIVSYIESRSRAVVVSQRLVGVNDQAKSKFIENLFDRGEWLDGTVFEADEMNIDLGTRTQSYFSYNFGNLPFSSGIKANHYPAVAQQSQLQIYYAKNNWAMMTANDGHGVDSVTKAWADTLKKARQLVSDGAKPDDLTGTFPYVAALFDEGEYEAAPMISKWAVRFIYSARRQDYAFTSMAAVWVVWAVMRWQINPTPQTYAYLPEWIRPTELQVFVPHIDMLDCISWPYFRDYVIQHPEMQHGELQWLAACTSGVQVKWPGTIEDALCIDGPTGRKRFTAEAEETIRDLQKWSLAASYRAFMPGIDGNIVIRTAENSGVKPV